MSSTRATRSVCAPTAEDLESARRLVSTHLAATPIDLGDAVERHPALKLETLQPTGSFKVRGALVALAAAPAEAAVVTASAGNHGLGLAFAAAALGRQVTVVVPDNASRVKVDRLRRSGVNLVQKGSDYDEAEAVARNLADAGGYFLSPYNNQHVIAGQATIGFELDDQLGEPMTVVCGVGGGGLAAGLCSWASNRPDIHVVGVEADASTAVSSAIAAGRQTPVDVRPTLADGLAGNLEANSVTVGIIANRVDQVVTVSEDEIQSALRYLVTERGYVAEGAGAAPVAALLAGKITARGRVVAILSGRNITPSTLATVLGGTPS